MFDSPCDQGPKMTTVTWMPAHTTFASIGTALKSDDTALIASDHRGNAAADTLAKEAAHDIRAPVNVRAEIDATLRVTHHIAQYLGHATFAANHHPLPPHRDSAPTTSGTALRHAQTIVRWPSAGTIYSVAVGSGHAKFVGRPHGNATRWRRRGARGPLPQGGRNANDSFALLGSRMVRCTLGS